MQLLRPSYLLISSQSAGLWQIRSRDWWRVEPSILRLKGQLKPLTLCYRSNEEKLLVEKGVKIGGIEDGAKE